jgi:hypothetical protein
MFLLLLDIINEYRAGEGKENLIEIKKKGEFNTGRVSCLLHSKYSVIG